MTAPPEDYCPEHADLRELCAWRHSPGDDGARLLDDVETFVARFVAFPSEHARVAYVLWAAHAHALHRFDSTPRLAMLSPEPGSGKTRAQEVLELLVPRPMFSLNASAAALFRKVSDPTGPPTVLLDECDTVFGPRAAKEHEDLRGFVNAGHRRGAVVARCVLRGKEVTVEDFPSYAAVSLSGLDDLPDTIMSRSVVIRMRRRAPTEQVEAFRRRIHGPTGEQLRDQLEEWTWEVGDALEQVPDMPDGIADRAADVWEALLAVADAAGGTWPHRARVAAVALVAAARGGGESLGVRLLRDLRDLYRRHGDDRLPTEVILENLNGMDEAPWGDLRGKPLDARGLAARLRKYEVKPKDMRHDGRVVKGYDRGDLLDAWVRYLPDDDPTPEVRDHLRQWDTREGYIDEESADLSLFPEDAATSATPATDSAAEDVTE